MGYPLYLTLLGGAVPALGVAATLPCNEIQSLAQVLPTIQRGLSLTTVTAYSLFMAIVTWAMIFSNLSLSF